MRGREMFVPTLKNFYRMHLNFNYTLFHFKFGHDVIACMVYLRASVSIL